MNAKVLAVLGSALIIIGLSLIFYAQEVVIVDESWMMWQGERIVLAPAITNTTYPFRDFGMAITLIGIVFFVIGLALKGVKKDWEKGSKPS